MVQVTHERVTLDSEVIDYLIHLLEEDKKSGAIEADINQRAMFKITANRPR
jgi:hypothetical protein